MFLLAGVILSPPPKKKNPTFAFSRNVAAEESGALSWFLVLFEIVWPKVFLSPSHPHTPHSSVWLLLSTRITSVPAHGTHKQLPLLVPSEEKFSLLIKANHDLPNSAELSLQKELGSKRVADKVHQSQQKRGDIKLLKKRPNSLL